MRELLIEKFEAPTEVDSDGAMYWKNDIGEFHHDRDRPAVIYVDGTKQWYKNGELHRDRDKPAVIWADGTRVWYKNGILHRDRDKPVVIRANETKEWWKNGEFIKIEYT